jgi:hypothetical protein
MQVSEASLGSKSRMQGSVPSLGRGLVLKSISKYLFYLIHLSLIYFYNLSVERKDSDLKVGAKVGLCSDPSLGSKSRVQVSGGPCVKK